MDRSAPTDVPSREDLLAGLLNRYSVGPRRVRAPGPTDEQISDAVRVALRAPDHYKLMPFRFVVVPDETRAALARMFEDFARRSGGDEEAVRREGERAHNGPALVAVVACIDANHPQAPEHEQWICVGGALAGFMNALHLMGFAGKILSGRKASDPAISRAFCGEGEQLVGWVVIGTPSKAAHPNCEDDLARVLQRWTGPPA